MAKIIRKDYALVPHINIREPFDFSYLDTPPAQPAPPGMYLKEINEKDGLVEYIYEGEEDDSQEDEFESYVREIVEEIFNNLLVDKIKVQSNDGNDADVVKHSVELSEETYLTEKGVSKITKIGTQTLRNHRSKGCGIPYSKSGRSVRYRLKDVLQYMRERKIKTK